MAESEGASDIKKRVLVYCPHIGGHRPIYCQRICRSLAEKGHDVFLFAIGHQQNSFLRVFSEVKSEYLDSLSKYQNIERIQNFDLADLYLDEIRFISNLQREWNIDTTLLVNGDEAMPRLMKESCVGPQGFPCRTVGLFINSEWVHDDGNDVKTLPLKTVSYRSFFRDFADRKSVLDGVIVTDDVLAEAFGLESSLCTHLPDITLPEQNPIEKGQADSAKVKALTNQFIVRNEGRKLVLFFGDLEKRKGFDFLLRFCAEEEDTVLLRVGRTKPGYSPGNMEDVSRKSKLVMEDRILEIDAFIDDICLVDYFFGLADFVPLPYNGFLRTSGLMLEAISRGLPVLVPDRGLMSARVKKFGLGMTFSSGSYEDFSVGLRRMMKSNTGYEANLKRYAETYSEEALARTMDWVLASSEKGGNEGISGDLLSLKSGDAYKVRKDLVCYAWNHRSTKRTLALDRFLDAATQMKVAVFGGGAYARWLEAMSAAKSDLQVMAVIDSRPDPESRLWNLKPELASSFDPVGVEVIVLATEAFSEEMSEDCRRYFGRDIKVIALN